MRYAISFKKRCGPLDAMQAAMLFPFVRLTPINMDFTKPDQDHRQNRIVDQLESRQSTTWDDVSLIEIVICLHSIAVLSGYIEPDRGMIESELYKFHVLFLFLSVNTKHSVLCDSLCHASLWCQSPAAQWCTCHVLLHSPGLTVRFLFVRIRTFGR